MSSNVKLSVLDEGQAGKVVGLLAVGEVRRRLLDLGIIGGTLIECVQKSPFGDPIAYEIRGAVIALRSEDANDIMVSLPA